MQRNSRNDLTSAQFEKGSAVLRDHYQTLKERMEKTWEPDDPEKPSIEELKKAQMDDACFENNLLHRIGS